MKQILPPATAIATLLGVLLLNACSDLKNNLPAPVAVQPVAHEAGWNDPASASFHGKYIMAHQWDLSACTRCHAQTFSGGTSGVSCASSGCHIDDQGTLKSPLACNTCHGQFSAPAADTVSFAPPRSIAGDSSVNSPGVGAHGEHLVVGDLGRLVKCQECHTVPSQFSSPGHIAAGGRAIVAFHGSLSALATEGGLVPAPAYESATNRCDNVYCHGDFRLTKAAAPTQYQYIFADSVMEGENYSPLWNGGSTEGKCGSCHGLPPKGHLAPLSLTTCGNSGCHFGVVDADGNIMDPGKHINGKIDIRGAELGY